jgi:gliding motility-associated-like protein
LTGFTVSGGCAATGDYGTPTAPVLCDGGTTSVTYTVTDLCNPSTVTQTFEVVAPPVVVVNSPANASASACTFADQAAVDAAFATWLEGFSVSGGCSPTGDYGTPIAPLLCGGSTLVTYNVTDLCESGQDLATFTLNTVNPIVVSDVQDMSVNACDYADQAALDAAFATWISGFSVSGGCDPQATDLSNMVAPVLCTGGSTAITYTITDLCETGEDTATFSVTAPTPPVLSDMPVNITVQCATDVPGSQSVTILDTCAISSSLEFKQSALPDCNGDVFNTWTATDACGNETVYIQTVTVDDTIAPVFTSSLPVNLTVECDAIPGLPTITATDNCGGTIDVQFNEQITGQDIGCPSNYTITRVWTATDCADNEEIHTQIITVEDTTAPTLSNLPEVEITVDCGSVPDIPTITVTDNCDNDVEMNFVETATTPDNEGNYTITRTWTFIDDCGNQTPFTQIVNVNVVDITTTSSSIDICIEDVSIDLSSFLVGATDSNGTWTDDNNSGGLSGDDFDPSIVNLGSYQFTYTSSDNTCNASVSIIINVNDDCVVLPCSTDDLYISRVVTANGDGKNETFNIGGLELCGFTYDVKILNRWGHMVFESGNYQNNWTGYNQGGGMTIGSSDKLPAGTYYYVVNIVGSGFKPITGYIYLGQ